MADRLKDRVAIVFGAGSAGPGWGNGKAAAAAYAREGAAVACIDVVLAAAEETAQIIRDNGGRAIALAADVTKSESVAEATQKTLAEYGLHRHPAQQCRRDAYGRPRRAEARSNSTLRSASTSAPSIAPASMCCRT